jgi:hypothetical protein
MTRTYAAFLTIMVVACSPSSPRPAASPAAPDRAGVTAFVVRLGRDTIALERFTRSGTRIEGEMVGRFPEATRTRYSITVDSLERIVQLRTDELDPSTGRPTKPRAWSSLAWNGSGYTVELNEGDSTRHAVLQGPLDLIPNFGRSLAVYELITRQFRDGTAASRSFRVVRLWDLAVDTTIVSRMGPDTVSIHVIFPRGERARVDASGNILGISGLHTSYKWLTERVPDVNAAALAKRFAAEDAKHAGMGNLSWRDTVHANISGAAISIDYGRPARRGRAIFGALVPWNAVWRTGADIATQLTTDRELTFDSLTVPPGTYSLYTLPTPNGWHLIINKMTGQNGLMYVQGQDLGRVALPTRIADLPLERLTITLSQDGERRGAIEIAWDNVVARAVFAIKGAR